MSKRIRPNPWICIAFPCLEKPVGHAALIEHFDGARVQTAGA